MFLPRPSATKWYTSPPIDAQGTRIKFLVPSDWEIYPLNKTKTDYSIAAHSPRERDLVLPFGWRIPWKNAAPPASIVVYGRFPLPQPLDPWKDLNKDHWAYVAVNDAGVPIKAPMMTSRQIPIHSNTDPADISYSDANPEQFKRLNRIIMDSLTVLK